MSPDRKGLLRRLRPLIAGVIAVALLAVTAVFVLPRVVDYGDVWAALSEISWPWMLALAAAAVLNVVTFAPPLMASLPGIGFWPALGVTLSSTASTYIAPGGPAVGMALSFGMLRGWGYRGRRVTLAVGVSSIWNLFVTFGVPSVAVVLLSLEGGSNALLRTAATGGMIVFLSMVAAFAVGLRSAWQARVVGDTAARITSWLLRFIRRGPVGWSGETFVRFRHDAIGLLRARWHWITLSTLAGHLTVYVVLIVTLRAVGIEGSEVSYAESFASWSIVRVLAALPITPGGFGLVEVGLTGSLIAFGGNQGDVLAAVLIYRALTVGPPLLLGALFAATWRRRHADWSPEEQDGAAVLG